MPKHLYDNSDIISNSKQIALLKQHFPNCFDKEGNFVIHKNEVAQLKLLCDEVFGEENFEGHIHWRRRHNQPNDKTKMIGLVAEHILAYSKNKDAYKKSGVGKLPLTGNFSNPDNDPNGDWASKPWKTGSDQGGSTYTITTPTGKVYTEVWMGEEKTFKELLANNRIIFPKNGSGSPRKKYYKFEREEEGQSATNWWNHDLFGHNQEANNQMTTLFDGVKNIFSNPKSTKLIEKIILLSNVKENDVVLDFFAGSGTTAHAVMALNAEDSGDRKFITVQIAEETDKKSEAYKAGYKTIFDITKARIEKASKQLNDKSGFKIFETTPIFEHYLDDLEELTDNTTLFNGRDLSNDQLETLLTTWKVHDGMKLHKPLAELTLGSYVAHYSDNIVYFMYQGFDLEALQAFVAKLDNDEAFEPSKLVLFGYNFDSKYQREFREALSNYTNKKSIELDMVVRY